MQIPDVPQLDELLLGKFRVNQREGHGVKSKVPRRKPGIFPLVGHGEDGVAVEVSPVLIATGQAGGGRLGIVVIAVEPSLHVVPIALLAPDPSREGLTLQQARVGIVHRALELLVVFVTRANSCREEFVEIMKWCFILGCGQPQAEPRTLLRRHVANKLNASLGALLRRVQGSVIVADDIAMECVLKITLGLLAVYDLNIRVVVGEKQRRVTVNVKKIIAERMMRGMDGSAA